MKLNGTVMMVVGTLADVKQIVEQDVYYTAGVWDKEKVSSYQSLPH